MSKEYRVVDAHVAGACLRLLISGVPTPRGASMADRVAWFERRADHVRRATMREPRGHRDLIGAVLTEPVTADADAGLLFLDADGYPSMSGVAVIGAATIALERGLITKSTSPSTGSHIIPLVFDTPSGVVNVRARMEERPDRPRVSGVHFQALPAVVAAAGVEVSLASRRLRLDIAHCGGFYAIVDSEAAGIPLSPDRLPDLRRLGVDLCAALDRHPALAHPAVADVPGDVAVAFTGPPHTSDAQLRCVTVTAHGSCDHSPSPAASAAIMAVLSDMELLGEGDGFVTEGMRGLVQRGLVTRRMQTDERLAVIVDIEAAAWTTGEQTLFVDEGDPLGDGIRS